MSVPGEGFGGLRLEIVSPEQEKLAREAILEDCLGLKERGALHAYAELAGPAKVDKVSEQAGVPTSDPRFELQLAMDAAIWADQQVEAWINSNKPADKELAVVCRVYGLGYGPGFYYDDLLRALAGIHKGRVEKLDDHRRRLDPYDDVLADMWIRRAYPQSQPRGTLH